MCYKKNCSNANQAADIITVMRGKNSLDYNTKSDLFNIFIVKASENNIQC